MCCESNVRISQKERIFHHGDEIIGWQVNMQSIVDFGVVDLGATEDISMMLAGRKGKLPIVLEQEWIDVGPSPVA